MGYFGSARLLEDEAALDGLLDTQLFQKAKQVRIDI
jgi:hypothetical protein